MLFIVNLIGPLAYDREMRYVHRITSRKCELNINLLETLLEFEDIMNIDLKLVRYESGNGFVWLSVGTGCGLLCTL
jgi:hypothetical protein